MFIYIKKILFRLLQAVSTVYAERKCASFGAGLKVNYPSVFTQRTFIGHDCHFNGMKIVGKGAVYFGNHVHSGSQILIITQNHNYYSPDELPYDEIDIGKDVVIGDAVWIGSRVIILPGTRIGDGVVIQAGAVVSVNIPDCAVIGGSPVRVFKYRDINRYNELLTKGAYVGWKRGKVYDRKTGEDESC